MEGFMLLFFFACANNMETHEEFSTLYAESQCRAYKQCNRSLFDGKYGTMKECEEEVQEEFWEENNTLYEGCSYLSEKADECITVINQSNCGELWTNSEQIYESCHNDVWGCL